MDQRADAGDDQDHHRRQRVEAEGCSGTWKSPDAIQSKQVRLLEPRAPAARRQRRSAARSTPTARTRRASPGTASTARARALPAPSVAEERLHQEARRAEQEQEARAKRSSERDAAAAMPARPALSGRLCERSHHHFSR